MYAFRKPVTAADFSGLTFVGIDYKIWLVLDPVSKERAVPEAEKVLYRCLERGLSFKLSQGNVIQWCPPLIITREELQQAVNILRQALGSLTIP